MPRDAPTHSLNFKSLIKPHVAPTSTDRLSLDISENLINENEYV